jgi:SagB-type dehydrogenase family enzyme
MNDSIGDKFQKETRYIKDKLPGGSINITDKPETYKEYPNCNTLELPDSFDLEILNFAEVLMQRKSIRNFSSEPITEEELAYLLWGTTGIQRVEEGYEFRTIPSAGALYPIETYLIINNVEGIPEGIYHYNIKNHYLEELKTGDFSDEITEATLGQTMCSRCAVVFVWTAVFARTLWKYKQRGYRYIYLDAGHVGHSLALTSTSINLGSCQIGALFDEECNNLIGVDGEKESVIYISVVGFPV